MNSSCVPMSMLEGMLPPGTMGMVQTTIAGLGACATAQEAAQSAVTSCVMEVTDGNFSMPPSYCPASCVSSIGLMMNASSVCNSVSGLDPSMTGMLDSMMTQVEQVVGGVRGSICSADCLTVAVPAIMNEVGACMQGMEQSTGSLPSACYTLALTVMNSSCVPMSMLEGMLPAGTMGMVETTIAGLGACATAQEAAQSAVTSCVMEVTDGNFSMPPSYCP